MVKTNETMKWTHKLGLFLLPYGAGIVSGRQGGMLYDTIELGLANIVAYGLFVALATLWFFVALNAWVQEFERRTWRR